MQQYLSFGTGREDGIEALAGTGGSTTTCACGAIYCCDACRRADVSRGHALLCESGRAAAAWRDFRVHAREEAELPELELAAKLLAVALLSEESAERIAPNEGCAEDVGRHAAAARHHGAPHGHDTAELRRAALALALVQEPIATVLGRDASGAAAAAHTLRDVERSCGLLRRAALLACGAAGVSAARIRRLASMDGRNSFGNLVGLAFLNQVAIVRPSPAPAHSASALAPLDATGLSWFVLMISSDLP